MNQVNRSSQPLEFTTGTWVALALVVMVGLLSALSDAPDLEDLGYLHSDNPVILRVTGQTHEFPVLGVIVSPPDGWTYLSRTEDAIASKPTFVNLSGDAVLRLLSRDYYVWKEDAELKRCRYGQAIVDWTDTEPREVGKLSREGQGLTVVAITRTGKPHQNPSVADFCAAIRFMGSK